MRKVLTEREVKKLDVSLDQLGSLLSKDIGYPIELKLEESKNYRKEQSILIQSELLPVSFFGIFERMISKATINSFNNINWDNGRIVFKPHFSYEHYGHGTNGHEMYDSFGKEYWYEFNPKNGTWGRLRE